jgi:tRNA-specific 2-thiouridylase
MPSGGVERFPRTALLLEAGWQVEGLIFWLMSSKGACCAEGVVDAAANCDQLATPRHLRSVPHRARLVPIGNLAESARLQFAKPQLSLTPG